MKCSVRRLVNALIARHFLRRLRRRPPRQSDGRRRERAVLRAFRRAARRQAVYRNFLKDKGVSPASIRTFEDFERAVPFVAKENLFGEEGLNGFFARGSHANLATLYASSGFSTRFAFGAFSRRDKGRIAFFMEEILFRLCGITERDLLIVNCLSLGTEIPLVHYPQAKTGLRSDAVVEVLRRAAAEFPAIVLAGEPLFLKRVAEEGTEAGLAWERLKIWIFTGGEYVSEYWRAYLRSLLRQDPAHPEEGGIYITYGLTEFGLAVGFETAPLAALRRALAAEPVRGKGGGTAAGRSCPPFLYYLPGRHRLETAIEPAGGPELAVTALDDRRLIPLVRYRTGDEAELYSPAEINGLLSRYGLDRMPPVIRGLPAAALHGRRFPVALAGGGPCSANEIKDALFMDQRVARAVTGIFRVEGNEEGGRARLLVQLSPGVAPDGWTEERLKENLAACGAGGISVVLYAWRDFPFGFEHEFERKVNYLG